MADIRLSVAARTHVGRVRHNNEDTFAVADLDTGVRIDDPAIMERLDVRKRGVLMMVSDGMGGHAAGEVASALVVDSLRASLGNRGGDESMERLIEEAVKRANTDVYEAAQGNATTRMGATLTAVLVHNDKAYIAEVGDSRAYVLRRDRLRQVTKDQSFVQVLVDSGAITSEQAENFPRKNWVVQAMGLQEDVKVSIGRLELRCGDRLLLCSDGLHNAVGDDDLAGLLSLADLNLACERMIALANERGGQDNITAVVAEVFGDGLQSPYSNESVTQTFEVLQEFKGLHLLSSSSKPPARNGDDDDDDDDVDDVDDVDDDDDLGGDLRPLSIEDSSRTNVTLPPSRAIFETPDSQSPDRPKRRDRGDPTVQGRGNTRMVLAVAAMVLLLAALGYWFFLGP